MRTHHAINGRWTGPRTLPHRLNSAIDLEMLGAPGFPSLTFPTCPTEAGAMALSRLVSPGSTLIMIIFS